MMRLFAVAFFAVPLCACAERHDVASYVWPAYQPEPRWAELGIFANDKGDAATAEGVNVFIYDWYWYGGRPFPKDALNKSFLVAKNCERMKSYIMFANHSVNRLWGNTMGRKSKNGIVWPAKISDVGWRTIVARWTSRCFKRPNCYIQDKGLPSADDLQHLFVKSYRL